MMTEKKFIQCVERFLEVQERSIEVSNRSIEASERLHRTMNSLHIDLRPELSKSSTMQRIEAEQRVFKNASAKAIKKYEMRNCNRTKKLN